MCCRRWPMRSLLMKVGFCVGCLLLIATQTQAGTFYFHNDQLGTPQALTDDAQAVVWKGEYGPFGVCIEVVDLIEQNLRFPGQYFDQETGLHYNFYRSYDPNLGRYIESDPIGLGGGLNTFSYALNDPISLYDPYGLWVLPSLPDWFVDASAGFGDTISFGFTNYIRDQAGTNGIVNKCSAAFSAAQVTGTVFGFFAGATGLAKAGFRLERGNWKQAGEWVAKKGHKKLHFHYGTGAGLTKHHLPYQGRNWWKNFKSNINNRSATTDIFHSIFSVYGFGVGLFGASNSGSCEC